VTHLGQRLSALIDGELDGAERDRVLVHLAKCESCRADAIALRTLKRRMNALGETAADGALAGRLMGLPEVADQRLDRRGRWVESWPGVSGSSVASLHVLRPAWYVVLGAVAVILAGLGAAAFMVGGAVPSPAPKITPAVDMYVEQHDFVSGVVPATDPASPGTESSAPARP
jgi:anti-sigma factor RsiW